MTDTDGPAEGLTPERRSATVTIKDKPNSKATGNRIISGDAIVGQTLTADTGAITDGDGLTNARFTYQWSKGPWDQKDLLEKTGDKVQRGLLALPAKMGERVQ